MLRFGVKITFPVLVGPAGTAEKKKKAVVIMATGLGHVADSLLPKIRELTDEGKQRGPIILTGSQRSSDRPSSDAFENIEASVRFSMERIGEDETYIFGGLDCTCCVVYLA